MDLPEELHLELVPIENLFFTEILEAPYQPVEENRRRVYKCKYCRFVTGWLSNLNRHENTHVLKNFYRCSVCWRDFNQITNLKTHLKNMHERPLSSIKHIETKYIGSHTIKYYG